MPEYVDGLFIKEIPTQFGGIININLSVDKFGASIKPKIEDGFVRIQIMKRKNPDKFGNTHYAKFNDYEYNQERQSNEPEIQQDSKPDDNSE